MYAKVLLGAFIVALVGGAAALAAGKIYVLNDGREGELVSVSPNGIFRLRMLDTKKIEAVSRNQIVQIKNTPPKKGRSPLPPKAAILVTDPEKTESTLAELENCQSAISGHLGTRLDMEPVGAALLTRYGTSLHVVKGRALALERLGRGGDAGWVFSDGRVVVAGAGDLSESQRVDEMAKIWYEIAERIASVTASLQDKDVNMAVLLRKNLEVFTQDRNQYQMLYWEGDGDPSHQTLEWPSAKPKWAMLQVRGHSFRFLIGGKTVATLPNTFETFTVSAHLSLEWGTHRLSFQSSAGWTPDWFQIEAFFPKPQQIITLRDDNQKNVAKCKVLSQPLESLKVPLAKPADKSDSEAPKPSEQRKAPQEDDASDKTKGPLEKLAVDLGGGVKMEMVLIPAGSFTMGDDKEGGDEKPARRVTITKPFYLGKYEVTQEQWEAAMGNNPSKFKAAKNPVEQVSWNDCQKFLDKLNAKAAAQGEKFALPTEAQWEYACRAGSDMKYCFGDDENRLGEYAWYDKNSGGKTHPVGEKKPNAWGLYDMHGNVLEWCADWYDAGYYGELLADDPMGPVTGSDRVYRGGGTNYFAGSCRSARRRSYSPESRGDVLGFRVSYSSGG